MVSSVHPAGLPRLPWRRCGEVLVYRACSRGFVVVNLAERCSLAVLASVRRSCGLAVGHDT